MSNEKIKELKGRIKELELDLMNEKEISKMYQKQIRYWGEFGTKVFNMAKKWIDKQGG